MTQKAIPPSAKDYADAFHQMENHIERVLRLARIADYLASLLHEDIEAGRAGSNEYLAKLAAGAASEVLLVADDFDAEFLERLNDLVGRENAARDPINGKVPVVRRAKS